MCATSNLTSEPRAVVLVEGASDRAAIEALARRYGRDLAAERVAVMAMSGASAIGDVLEGLQRSPRFAGRLAGLCDEREEPAFRRGLERAGLGVDLSRAEMAALCFFVCVADLEDELIRALGAAAVERVIDGEGELGGFRTFQNQPAWRGRPIEAQLRRFLGVRAGRKIRYGRLLVDALDLERVPGPLESLLSCV